MLNKIKLTHFRKHVDAEFSFNAGFTVFRGANEEGKSTIFEAIAYALFGVKALRTSLADAVTWGQPEASLKVELELTVDGVVYTVKRGKTGAAATYGGDGMVTGQSEVTGFMARILKVDAGTAAKLMLSNQKEIAAALEAGPKATTEMIERLAEFDQIDNLLGLMQEKLSLGNGATAQGQFDAANARLERARAVPEPDMGALTLAVTEAESRVKVGTAAYSAAQEAKESAQTDLAKAQASASERSAVAARLTRFEARYAAAMAEMSALKRKTVPLVPGADDQIQKLMAQKADAVGTARAAAAYEAVEDLLGDSGIQRFPGTAPAWEAELKLLEVNRDNCREALRKGDVMFAALQAKLSTGSCGFCGQDFSDLPSVKEKNEAISAEMASVAQGIKDAQTDLDRWAQSILDMKEIQAKGKATEDAARRYSEYLEVDSAVYPPMLAWKGPEAFASCTSSTDDIDNEIKRIRLAVREYTDHMSAIQSNDRLFDSFDTERTEIAERQKALGPLVNGDGVDKEAALKSAARAVGEAREKLATLTQVCTEAKDALRDAARSWEWVQREQVEAAAAVDVSREALLALDFNNALLKRVRAARPIIADRLWNLVLNSVSSYFSEMRGTPSIVSKSAEGFLIDGKTVQSFSGSTIDILGLAIRVALVRTFLPGCPFLILDEPAAACNEVRTSNMLGFLASAGFGQVITCSHDPLSESVCDHVVYLD